MLLHTFRKIDIPTGGLIKNEIWYKISFYIFYRNKIKFNNQIVYFFFGYQTIKEIYIAGNYCDFDCLG